MNKQNYDLSKFDKKIKNVIERLLALMESGKITLSECCDNEFWLDDKKGCACGGLSAYIAPATGEVSFLFQGVNGKNYRYLRKNLGIVFDRRNSTTGKDIPLTEGTVFEHLRAKIRQIELSPVDFE